MKSPLMNPLLLLKVAFRNTYLPNDTKNYSSEYSYLDYIASFIEIPNWRKKSGKKTEDIYYGDGLEQKQPLLKKQTWGNLGKKFVGWQDNVSTAKKVRNVFLAIFFFVPINLATVLIRTPINIVRLFTEFLPNFILAATWTKLREIGSAKKRSLGMAALAFLLGLIHVQAFFIGLASRSMTNPARAFMGAWQYGYGNPMIKNRYLRIFIGSYLAMTSLAFTIMGYTLLAGIPAIQAGAAALLHYAASVMPQVMAVLSGIGVITAKVATALLGSFPAAVQFIATSVAAMPELLGIAGLAALLMPTLGSLLSPVIVRFQENWYAVSEKKSNGWRSLIESEEVRETPAGFNPSKAFSSSSYGQVHRSGVNLISSRPSDELPTAKPVALSPVPEDVNTEVLDEVTLGKENAVAPRRLSLSASGDNS